MGVAAEEKTKRRKGKLSLLISGIVLLLVLVSVRGGYFASSISPVVEDTLSKAIYVAVVDSQAKSLAANTEAIVADVDLDMPTYAPDGFWNASAACNQKTLITACTCQEVSDYFGMWHYRSFLDASGAVQEWWIKTANCRISPTRGTRGWRRFAKYHANVTKLMQKQLVDQVEALGKDEPGSKRQKRNAELLEGIMKDPECFHDPDWPSVLKCGEGDISARFKHFNRLKAGCFDQPGEDDLDSDKTRCAELAKAAG